MMRSAIYPARLNLALIFLLVLSSMLRPVIAFSQCEGVRATSNFAIPPYAMWHYSQLRDFSVYQEIEVDTSCGPVQYKIAFHIWQEGGDTLISIPDLESLGTPYCLPFPKDAPWGNYTGRYTVTSDLPGDDLSDNEQFFHFVIGGHRYAKEILFQPYITLELTEDRPLFGSYFFINEAFDIDISHFLDCVEVGMANPEAFKPSVLGEQGYILALIYEWKDKNQDGFWDWEGETNNVGFGVHEFEENEQPNSLIRMEILKTIDFEFGVALDHDAVYLVAAVIDQGQDTIQVPKMLYSVEHDYTLNNEWNQFQPYGTIDPDCSERMGQLISEPDILGIKLGAFPLDTVPLIRVMFTCHTPSQVEEEIKPQTSLLVANLVHDYVTVRIEPVMSKDATLMIVRLDGAIVYQQKMGSSDNSPGVISVAHLPPGAYFATLRYRDGVRTEKFFIQR